MVLEQSLHCIGTASLNGILLHVRVVEEGRVGEPTVEPPIGQDRMWNNFRTRQATKLPGCQALYVVGMSSPQGNV
eukprot:5019941-Amphidinium_carterae.1